MMRKMDQNEIQKFLELYRNDKSDNFAVLMTGAWGCGKTFFIKNELLGNSTPYVYISLYGIETVSDLKEKLIIECIKHEGVLPKSSTFGILEELPKNVSKVLISSAKNHAIDKIGKTAGGIVGAVLDTIVNIDSIYDALIACLDNTNPLFIFDDFERCPIPINKTLSFINDLTEHRAKKCLVVTDENNIPKTEKEKYIESKDKIIRTTVYFCADLESTLPAVIKSLNLDKNTESILNKEKENILTFLQNNQFYNIRKIRSGLHKSGITIGELLKITGHKNDIELRGCIVDVIKYYIYDEFYPGDASKKFENNSLLEKNVIASFNFLNGVDPFSLRLDHSYIHKIESHIDDLVDQRLESDDPLETLCNDSYRMDDDMIVSKCNTIIQNLRNGRYLPKNYPKILLTMLRMSNLLEKPELLKNVKEYIFADSGIRELANMDDASFMHMEETALEREEFQALLDELKERAKNIVNEELRTCLSDTLEPNTGWGKRFLGICKDNLTSIREKNQFLSIVEMDKLISVLAKSNVPDICDFRDALYEIYEFNVISDKFVSDISSIKKFQQKLKEVKIESKNGRRNLDYIIGDFDRLLANIDKCKKRQQDMFINKTNHTIL